MTTDRTEDYRAAYALFAASERLDGGMITELVSQYGAGPWSTACFRSAPACVRSSRSTPSSATAEVTSGSTKSSMR